MNTRLEISLKTLIIAAVAIVGAWMLFLIRDILYLLFVAFLLMTAIQPLVTFLERIRLPRIISLVLIYLLLFGLFGWVLASSIPTIIVQTTRLAQELPDVISKVMPYWKADLNTLTAQVAPIGENLIKVTVDIFTNIITTLAVLMFTFYFLLERHRTKETITNVFGEGIAVKVIEILRAIEMRIGEWVRGQLILMLIIGIFVYIGLLILRIDFALPLAIVAGLLEIVPNIGPIISAIPAVLIGLAVSPLLALSVIALYIIVHQVEGNLIVPFVMKQSVGLSPIITILALLVGGKLAGIMGAVLAVPVVLVCQVLIVKLLVEPSVKKPARDHIKNPLPK